MTEQGKEVTIIMQTIIFLRQKLMGISMFIYSDLYCCYFGFLQPHIPSLSLHALSGGGGKAWQDYWLVHTIL